jgi:hypothetical protein
MNKNAFALSQANLFEDCKVTTKSGQNEYALSSSAFDNFERLARILDVSKEKILWVYFMKHVDGISSFLNGHISQREPVSGRIKDAIVYLSLLNAMYEEQTFGGPNDAFKMES